jgi:hypothetical protein
VENQVQVVSGLSGHYTTLWCNLQGGSVAPAGGLVFTLQVNGGAAALTCTIAAGASTGSGTGSVTATPGDLVDIAAPSAGVPNNTTVSAQVTVGP